MKAAPGGGQRRAPRGSAQGPHAPPARPAPQPWPLLKSATGSLKGSVAGANRLPVTAEGLAPARPGAPPVS